MFSLPAIFEHALAWGVGGMYLARKGMHYYSHWDSNLHTVQCEDSCDKAVSSAIPTAATVHHSQRPAAHLSTVEDFSINCLVLKHAVY